MYTYTCIYVCELLHSISWIYKNLQNLSIPEKNVISLQLGTLVNLVVSLAQHLAGIHYLFMTQMWNTWDVLLVSAACWHIMNYVLSTTSDFMQQGCKWETAIPFHSWKTSSPREHKATNDKMTAVKCRSPDFHKVTLLAQPACTASYLQAQRDFLHFSLH